jgi:hypothetical protein
VQELIFGVWHQRHEELLREAERDRLVRELRAARRWETSCRGTQAGRISATVLAALRVSKEKARCWATRGIGRVPAGERIRTGPGVQGRHSDCVPRDSSVRRNTDSQEVTYREKKDARYART